MRQTLIGIFAVGLTIGTGASLAFGGEGPKIFFDPYENKVVEEKAELIYDAASSKGSLLRLGPRTFEDSTFSIEFVRVADLQPRPALKPEQIVLVARVPTAFVQLNGKLELTAIDDEGKILWKESNSYRAGEKWVANLRELWQKSGKSEARPANGFWVSEFGLLDAEDALEDLKKAGKELRFCLSDRSDELGTKMCTAKQRLQVDAERVKLERTGEVTEALVRIDEKDASLGGKLSIEPGQTVRFFARLTSGATLEFHAKSTGPEMSDIVRTTELTARATGMGAGPFGAVALKGDQPEGWLERAWAPTIGVPPQYWTINIDSAEPFVYYPGEGGGIFRRKILFDGLPTEDVLPIFVASTPDSTYAKSVDLKLRKPKGVELSSEESEIVDPQGEEPTWRFKTANSAGTGRAHLKAVTEKNKNGFVGHFEIDRRLPYELSGRLSGMTFETRGFLLTEAALGMWYENFLGSKAPWATRRWGANLRYSNAALGISTSRDGVDQVKDVRFAVAIAELRYRFEPGTWGHDESWGLLTSLQSLGIGEAEASMGGVGFWWGRSMPRVFENLFNILPFMRHPKWVDLDFTYFPLNLSKDADLGATWVLNFHGKIYWTERFFGEAGFGSKQYNFVDYAERMRSNFNALYVTGGLGLNF